jgi:hypothetical protein
VQQGAVHVEHVQHGIAPLVQSPKFALTYWIL